MKMQRLVSWVVFVLAAFYFLVPLIGTLEFSLRALRGVYSLDAYRNVLGDPQFQQTLAYSVLLSIATVVLGVLIVAPTAFWGRMRPPRLRPAPGLWQSQNRRWQR